MTCSMLTLGHSTRSFDAFAELCRGAGIELVCDVRRLPASRRHPHFARERLEEELPRKGIAYEWLGEELGGFREGGYEAWTASAGFERGLARLERLAREHAVGFMCAEGVPWKCHRRLVADALAARGHRIDHVLPDGSLVGVQPPLGPEAR